LQLERHPVVVGEPQRQRDLITSADQVADAVSDLCPDLLGTAPHSLSFVLVVRLAKYLEDLVVVQPLAVDCRTKRSELTLDRAAELHDRNAVRVVHLVARERETQDFQLSSHDGVVNVFLQRVGDGRVGIGISLEPPNLELELGTPVLVLRRRAHLGIPVSLVKSRLGVLEPLFQIADEMRNRCQCHHSTLPRSGES
jgi:hypothetical protein